MNIKVDRLEALDELSIIMVDLYWICFWIYLKLNIFTTVTMFTCELRRYAENCVRELWEET